MSKNLDINNLAPGRPCRLLVENVYDQATGTVLLSRSIVDGAYAVEVDGRIFCGSGSDFFCVDDLLVGEHPKYSVVEVHLVDSATEQAKPGAEIMAASLGAGTPVKS